MKLDKEARLALIAKVQNDGDIASIHTLYDFYREKFEAAAMYHFNRHPFDYEIAKLRNDDARKQWFVFGAAYEAFDKTCRNYKPVCSFATWMNREIEWSFEEKNEIAKAQYKAEAGTWRCNNGHNVSLGKYVDYGNATVWRQFDTDNHESDSSETDNHNLIKAILEAVPSESRTHDILTTWIEGEAESESAVAQLLGISQPAVSKNLKSLRKRLNTKLLQEYLENQNG
ncbi:LysR family transcriptional regulator [Fibrobacter sp. UWB5]|uniref:helix-turn-helix domain-containing protein n=1 Tax=Fibrobacter sp. UWB5 TaxID=1964360 RepID=UPI00130305EE|nr:LysR family transcriptional regulator [Fibrobacter sp. UWB5]